MIILPDEANHSYQEALTIQFNSSTSLNYLESATKDLKAKIQKINSLRLILPIFFRFAQMHCEWDCLKG